MTHALPRVRTLKCGMWAPFPEGLAGDGRETVEASATPPGGSGREARLKGMPRHADLGGNEGGNVTDQQHHDVQQIPGGFITVAQQDQEHDNPVVHHLSVFKTRARILGDSRVEAKAQQLQAANSYDDWEGLSDADKELWRHMARLDPC